MADDARQARKDWLFRGRNMPTWWFERPTQCSWCEQPALHMASDAQRKRWAGACRVHRPLLKGGNDDR